MLSSNKMFGNRSVASIVLIVFSVLILLFSSIWLLEIKFGGQASIKTFFHQNPVGVAEEVNGLVPEFPRHPRIFWNNSDYGPTDHVEHISDDEKQRILKNWGNLQARGFGFVPIHDPSQYELPPPLRYDGLAPPDYYYSISAFHQIHCLEMILQEYLYPETLYNYHDMEEHSHKRSKTVHSDKDGKHAHSHKTSVQHLLHCFDYLRQAIMCAGDTALEGADEYSIAEGRDFVTIGTTGLGTTHQCKDWDAIVEYAESHANPKWMHGKPKPKQDPRD